VVEVEIQGEVVVDAKTLYLMKEITSSASIVGSPGTQKNSVGTFMDEP